MAVKRPDVRLFLLAHPEHAAGYDAQRDGWLTVAVLFAFLDWLSGDKGVSPVKQSDKLS